MCMCDVCCVRYLFLGDDGNTMWCLCRPFVCVKMSMCVLWVDLCGVVCFCGCECSYMSCYVCISMLVYRPRLGVCYCLCVC